MRNRTRIFDVLTCLVLWVALAAPAQAGGKTRRYFVAGPVEAELVSVVDGDTLMVDARPWPQQTVSVLVRIRGVDTPELRSACRRQREQAEAARRLLAETFESGNRRIVLSAISGDKYFGRVVADVRLSGDRDAASLLLGAGLAKPYDGKRKSRGACMP